MGHPLASRACRRIALGACEPHCRTTECNTPKHEFREVRYPWHPLYGKTIIVQGQLLRHGCSLCKCVQLGQQAGIGFELPIWMLDSAYCSRMQLADKPQVSWQALVSLKQLWQEALEPARALRQSGDKNPAGSAYAHNSKPARRASQSIRSDCKATAMERSAPRNSSPNHATVDPTAAASRGSKARPGPERRSR